MIDLESRLALADDAPAVETFLAEHRGVVHGPADPADDDGVRWVELAPRSASSERYIARLAWVAYPQEPPSVLFTDAVGGALGVAAAWPLIAGYRAPNDICMPFTREGYALHPEWSNGPTAWTPSGNPFLRVVAQLQDDLDYRYQGRAA